MLYVAKKRMGEGDLLALLLFFTATFPVSLSPWIYLQLLGSLAIYALHALARLVENYSLMSKLFPDKSIAFKAYVSIAGAYVTEEEFKSNPALGYPAYRVGKGILATYLYPYVTYLAISYIFLFTAFTPL